MLLSESDLVFLYQLLLTIYILPPPLKKKKKKKSKAVFDSCKIFFGNDIFGKGKYFQVFSCISKNVLKNIF